MKNLIFLLFIVAGLATFYYACEAPKSYPNTPEVSFKSILIEDSLDLENPGNSKKMIKLTIRVVDGNGDIGIVGDNNFIYPGFEDLENRNLFITLYEKIDGVFVETENELGWNYATPYLEPEGQDKTLKADIEVSMDINFAFYTYDTIKYSFYIYDRAKNISNIGESPEIPADSLGLIE
ncbi:MAG: hypothetical protein P1P88_00710 [Bacteroidales bacterium]|nr:hypothetical protein [Bacteroidales bacterium]